jgi:sarcosine oxidase subunit delta
MLQIPCIHCGPRDESEFTCGGTSHMVRPGLEQSDATWGEYLFFRDNPKGLHLERWRHTYGCGRWFNVARHTVTHEIFSVYAMTDPPPALAPP